MKLMVVGGCRSIDVVHSKGRYRKPIVVTTLILDHIYGHYVKPNKVAFKYLDFKIDVNLDVHVKIINSLVKSNAETFEEYIINVFSYTLKYTTLN